jgi:uncharacterized protein with GYD domain
MRLIVLLKLGPQSLPDRPTRNLRAQIRDMVDDLARSPQIGGQLQDMFWTLGPHDIVIVAEVRNPVAAQAFSLTLSRKLKAQHLGLPALRDGEADPVFDVLELRNGP